MTDFCQIVLLSRDVSLQKNSVFWFDLGKILSFAQEWSLNETT